MNYVLFDTTTGIEVGEHTSLVDALRAVHRLNCHAMTWQGESDRYRLVPIAPAPYFDLPCSAARGLDL